MEAFHGKALDKLNYLSFSEKHKTNTRVHFKRYYCKTIFCDFILLNKRWSLRSLAFIVRCLEKIQFIVMFFSFYTVKTWNYFLLGTHDKLFSIVAFLWLDLNIKKRKGIKERKMLQNKNKLNLLINMLFKKHSVKNLFKTNTSVDKTRIYIIYLLFKILNFLARRDIF